MYVMCEHKYIIVGSAASVVGSPSVITAPRFDWMEPKILVGSYWIRACENIFGSTGNSGTAEPETFQLYLFSKSRPD